MLYDKYPGVPPRGSPLESILVVVANRRQDAMARGVTALILGKDSEKSADAFQDFLSSMFPYLQDVEDQQKDEAKEALMDLVGKKIQIDTSQIGRPERSGSKQVSRAATERFRIQPKIPGV